MLGRISRASGTVAGVAVAALALWSASCQGQAPDDDDTGQIALAVAAAPAGVGCVRVTVAGATRSEVQLRPIDVTTGVATTATLSGLPAGAVNVSADAFAETCASLAPASVAAWSSDPMMATLTPDVPVPVQLVMEQDGIITLGIEWDTPATPAPAR